jgi:hypothetical protein
MPGSRFAFFAGCDCCVEDVAMNEHSTNPTEDELSDDIIRRAIASMEEGSIPAGPPPELIAATQDVLKYPFRSREVRDICKHLTPDESRRFTTYGKKVGFVGGVAINLILYGLMFLWMWLCTPFYPPFPSFRVVWLMAIPVGLLVGWIVFAGYRRKQRRMLCETDYAKRMGFTPDTLPLHDFARNKGLLILSAAAVTLIVALMSMGFELLRPDYGDPVAGQIIDRMASVYANCRSYQDTGVFTTLFVTKTGNRTVAKTFTTAFVRSDRFRFEYKEELGGTKPYRCIIWSNWKDVRPWWNFWSARCEIQTWWDVKPGIEKPGRFDYALAGVPAAGVSKLLLRRDMQFQEITAVMEAKLAEDGQLDGVECCRVEGKHGHQLVTLWIDKKSYLVRRINTQFEVNPPEGDSFHVEETTTYEPVIDEKIADKLLEFDPPVEK